MKFNTVNLIVDILASAMIFLFLHISNNKKIGTKLFIVLEVIKYFNLIKIVVSVLLVCITTML